MRYSIIIPVYNTDAYLSDCLDSILAQSCDDWECICVDDGSSDDSWGILEGYSARDARIRGIKQEHAGVGKARNVGLAVATGDYCLFVDADDVLLPHALAGLDDESADIVTFLPLRGRGASRQELTGRNACVFFSSLVGNMIGWNAMYRRKVIADVTFPNLINCEDLVFAAGAYVRANTIVAGVEPWYRHREVVGSAYNSHSWRRVVDSYKSVSLMYGTYAPLAKRLGCMGTLLRKLAAHFVLHVVAEVPKAIFSGKVPRQKKTYRP